MTYSLSNPLIVPLPVFASKHMLFFLWTCTQVVQTGKQIHEDEFQGFLKKFVHFQMFCFFHYQLVYYLSEGFKTRYGWNLFGTNIS